MSLGRPHRYQKQKSPKFDMAVGYKDWDETYLRVLKSHSTQKKHFYIFSFRNYASLRPLKRHGWTFNLALYLLHQCWRWDARTQNPKIRLHTSTRGLPRSSASHRASRHFFNGDSTPTTHVVMLESICWSKVRSMKRCHRPVAKLRTFVPASFGHFIL